MKSTRFWVLKSITTGNYYAANGPPYWVKKQVDAWRYNEIDARYGESINKSLRAVRVYKVVT